MRHGVFLSFLLQAHLSKHSSQELSPLFSCRFESRWIPSRGERRMGERGCFGCGTGWRRHAIDGESQCTGLFPSISLFRRVDYKVKHACPGRITTSSRGGRLPEWRWLTKVMRSLGGQSDICRRSRSVYVFPPLMSSSSTLSPAFGRSSSTPCHSSLKARLDSSACLPKAVSR